MEEFIKLVEVMRESQRNYFRARRIRDGEKAAQFLAESKQNEQVVDEFIKKHHESKIQPKLF